MLKRLLILASRNLIKQKQTTIICILGLTIALSVVLQIVNWCIFELSYDKYHSKADRIYRFTVEENRPDENFYWHFARSWQTWRSKLPDFYPEIESLVELRPRRKSIIKTPNNLFYSDNAYAVDSSIFKVFDFEFISGDPKTVIKSENTVVISESMAKKLFPKVDATNQAVELLGDSFKKFVITGVFKDLPANSHFHIDILIHYKPQETQVTDFAYTYILLKEGTSISQLTSLSDKFIKTHVPEDQQKGSIIHYTPLTDIHLKSHIEREIELNGDIKQIKLFIYIALGILIIAFINYFNLMMASIEKRNKYFNLNIIIGGRPKHNILLSLIESLYIAIIVIIIASAVFKPASSFLSSVILEKTIPASINIYILVVTIAFFILVALLGILPVYIGKISSSDYLSKHSTVNLLNKKSLVTSNPMLVLQFAVSIIVIISSLILNKQNNFLFEKNLGYGNSNILMLSRGFYKEEPEVMLLKDEIMKLSGVEDVSMTMDPPGYLVKDARRVQYADIPRENKSQIITILPVDGNFFNFFNLPMVAGESKEYFTGQQFESYVLNESAIKKLGFRSPEEAIGTPFKMEDFNQGVFKGGTITGVVKDFNFSSLYTPIEPTIFFSKPIWQWRYLVKLAPGNKNKNLAQVEKVWNQVFPEYPFDYQFLDDVYNEHYSKDIITNKLVGWFSLICIILSAIGLWGISSILVIKKTKEIGIRKVNGARVSEVLAMLNFDFVKWIIIAFIIAMPVSWYVMHKWLENFAYKTEISWWVFMLALIVALAVALLTVSWQSWRTATRNPVEALRYE